MQFQGTSNALSLDWLFMYKYFEYFLQIFLAMNVKEIASLNLQSKNEKVNFSKYFSEYVLQKQTGKQKMRKRSYQR